jgi:hypothetical protein
MSTFLGILNLTATLALQMTFLGQIPLNSSALSQLLSDASFVQNWKANLYVSYAY